MKIQILPETFSQTDFNAVAINPVQSWEWGESKKQLGIEVIRVGKFVDDDLKHTYQVTFHKIPYTNFTVGYLPRSEFPSEEVLQFLQNYAKKRKTIFIKIEPYEKKSEVKIDLSTVSHLKKSSHPLFPSWTQMLNILKSEDILFNNLKSKTRYNIRLAQKKGVVVKEESTDTGFEIFSKLYFDTTKRQNYHGHDKQYHKVVWDCMKKNIAHILIAYYENIPLAAYELFHFNDNFYYPYGGTSVLHRNLMASNLLMWEAILLGKKLGAKKFDMWGSLPPAYDEKSPWSGFTRFKEGYGTEFVKFIGSYDLIIDTTLYSLYTSLHKLRTTLLQFI